jgi:2-polyprenyl-3-methyl-5-hydroxy-6-metoxy-1,4-benzoquinol methylase
VDRFPGPDRTTCSCGRMRSSSASDGRGPPDRGTDRVRNRAAEYDETSRPVYESLAEYGNELVAALDRFRPEGEVLEIASGTGMWTAELSRSGAQVTALDSSSEMHEQARRKIGADPRARFVRAEVFSWKADSRYDVVFFANWLSHIPPGRFDDFWEIVDQALRPAGRVFFIDELRERVWRSRKSSQRVRLQSSTAHFWTVVDSGS